MKKLALTLTALLLATVLRAAEYPQQGSDIYNPGADGKAQIADALRAAKADGKHVLLDFGANWCPWCHKLHHVFTTNPEVKERLSRDYVLVYIDVNMRKGTKRNTDVNEKYGNPIKEGLPVLVVLDADDRLITTQETGALEDGDYHDPKKVAAFLDRWAPKK